VPGVNEPRFSDHFWADDRNGDGVYCNGCDGMPDDGVAAFTSMIGACPTTTEALHRARGTRLGTSLHDRQAG
jgi:hypothetical protein